MSIKKIFSSHISLVFLLSALVGVPFMTPTASGSEVDSLSICPADLNRDGVADIVDMAIVARTWHSYPGHPKWNPRADLNDDDVVNVIDMVLVMKDFGMTCIRYDFNEPLDWGVVSGTWNIVNGSLEGFSKAEGLIYPRNMTWKDCTLTAKVKIAVDSPTAEAAFCVRFVDSGNFYWAGLGSWGHRVAISRMIDHVPQELTFSGASADIVRDVWYNVSIKISGDEIMLYVNDVLELMVNDSTFTSGLGGIRPWNSHILVDYVAVSGFELTAMPPLKTEPEVYRGFAWASKDFIQYESLTAEHFKKVKSWGFNCILIPIWWSEDVEQDKNVVGVYNEQNLQRLRSSVDLALNEDLNVILSGRVCYDPDEEQGWDGWATHDYVNLQDEGLNRYAKFWEMMVQRFPDCMYCLWHFPYHRQGIDSERMNRFYHVTMPTLISAVRKHSNNAIVFVPIHQSPYYYEAASPVDDNNIIYGFGHMLAGKVAYGENWNYDYEELDNEFKGIKRWRENYDLPMMSVEYAPLRWVRDEPIDQSRLDALEESLKRMKTYGAGWMYWCISLVQKGGDNILANIENFEPNTSILTLLHE